LTANQDLRPASAWGAIGALSAGIAVLAEAVGAHALRGMLEPDMLEVFQLAARYQMLHALGLLATAWAIDRGGHPAVQRAAWLFIAGTIFFSGGLYAEAFAAQHMLGMTAPLGGLCFIAGWLSLAWGLWRRRPS